MKKIILIIMFLTTMSFVSAADVNNYVYNGINWIPWLSTPEGKPKVDLNLVNITVNGIILNGSVIYDWSSVNGTTAMAVLEDLDIVNTSMLDNLSIIRQGNISWIYSAPHTNLSAEAIYTLTPHTNLTASAIYNLVPHTNISILNSTNITCIRQSNNDFSCYFNGTVGGGIDTFNSTTDIWNAIANQTWDNKINNLNSSGFIYNLTPHTNFTYINSSNITVIGNQIYYNGTIGTGGGGASNWNATDILRPSNSTLPVHIYNDEIKLCNSLNTSCICHKDSSWHIGGTC